MAKHEAVFEIESKTDAYAVERLMERLYDSVREEERTLRTDTNDSSETLTQFETLRNASKRPHPGRLTVVFEQYDEEFDE